MKTLAAIVALSLLAGCWDSRSDSSQNAVHHDHFAIDGTMSLPGPTGPVPVPVHLAIDHDGTDRTTAHEERQASVDGAAIGREIAAVLGPVMAAGSATSPWGIVSGIGSAATALAGAGYLAHKARKGKSA